MGDGFPRVDITPVWARLNDSLIALVDYVPDDRINWSPKPDLWNFRGILLHIAAVRDAWLDSHAADGLEVAPVWQTARSKAQIQDAYRRTWARMERFLGDAAKLDAVYQEPEGSITGHWLAYHLLEHDIHHRADIFHYLALLGIETPGVGTP